MSRRAVIAATIGLSAGVIGLVLLGVGVAAATSGPSTGWAATPTPAAPATVAPDPAVVPDVAPPEVDMGLPPVPSSGIVVVMPSVASGAVLVAQEAPLADQAAASPAGPVIPGPADLPDTGGNQRGLVLAAWLAVLTGGAFVALRRVPRRERQVLRVERARLTRRN